MRSYSLKLELEVTFTSIEFCSYRGSSSPDPHPFSSAYIPLLGAFYTLRLKLYINLLSYR